MVDNIFNSDDQVSVTEMQTELAELRSQLAAIHHFQIVAEYTMNGTIIKANENFLNLMGYNLNELEGQNISMLLDLAYRYSAHNAAFWGRLNDGESISGKFKRIAKGVKTVWVQAIYCPFLDSSGKPFKVVEYAVDVTQQVQLERALTSMVEEVQEVATAVKNNNLTQRISLEGKTGGIACLSNDVNSLIECMAGIVTLITKTGDSIIAAANKVHVASEALSLKIENQAPLSEVDDKD